MTGPAAAAARARAFVARETRLGPVPLVPELRLHTAHEALPLWQRTEQDLAHAGLPPPFWAFAWAGGQALARFVLDHPADVVGRRVFDLGAGSGLVAIAAARAGACAATGNDPDPFAGAAMALNAAANGVHLTVDAHDRIGDASLAREVDTVLVGDVAYDRDLAARLFPWLARLAARGVRVLIGDPGRAYLPRTGLEALARYDVPVTRDLEDADIKPTTVWRVRA